MKAILMSIRPKWVAKILNGEKTIEIRKKFPKDYVGWMYIYCTKDSKSDETLCYDSFSGILGFRPNYRVGIADSVLNGKVVARFWCDKVEYIENTYDEFRWGEEDYNTETLNPDELYDKSCISFEEMNKYLKSEGGYVIHITKLEIFDEPKEISEFYKVGLIKQCLCDQYGNHYASEETEKAYRLTRAPQSWCYIEV